jgi:hypothetical protein
MPSHQKARSPERAELHTAIIADPVGMWTKLAWDVDAFRDIQVGYPDEAQPLCFAAINVCIAAESLRNWVVRAVHHPTGKAERVKSREQFDARLALAVPEQAMCDAIANTAKHSGFNEDRWTGGKVLLAYEIGDEDSPPGYILYHVIEDGPSEGLAVNRFAALRDNWWNFLSELNLTNGRSRSPEWEQNKLIRIFGMHAPVA